MNSYEIKLEGLVFHAFHGVYEEERKTGNKFTVDVAVRFPLSFLPAQDDIAAVPDYQVLHKLVHVEMLQARQLLETVAKSILATLWQEFPEAEQISISISKANPPIGTPARASSVTLVSDRPF